MDEQQARLILQAYRPGGEDKGDPHFDEALQEAARNPALARWFAEEQAFDRAMKTHLDSVPAPFGLRTRILAQTTPRASSRKMSWAVGLATVAASLFLIAQLIGLWRSLAPASGALGNYAQEMVSFVQLAPPLEMESKDLGAIKNWLAKKETIPMEVPSRLAALEPAGCRVLSFRGHDVTLICFHRDGDKLAHLFVVDRAAFPKLPGAGPIFSSEGEWTTATWAEKDRVYMIAVQGDRDAAEQYLPDA